MPRGGGDDAPGFWAALREVFPETRRCQRAPAAHPQTVALFVAIADLIPLVGATLGAVVAALARFVHSVPAGIAVVVFFLLYQQLENHLLQPLIFSRTVKLNPLTVLLAILIAVELAPSSAPCSPSRSPA